LSLMYSIGHGLHINKIQ